MTVDSVFIYVEESAKLCKELIMYLKKRQNVELEYAKNLGNILDLDAFDSIQFLIIFS